MTQYLMIENPGEAPIEGLTLMGATTKDPTTDDTVIGMFGSGTKYAVLALRSDQGAHRVPGRARHGELERDGGVMTINRMIDKAARLHAKNARAHKKGESRIRRKLARMQIGGRERFAVLAALLDPSQQRYCFAPPAEALSPQELHDVPIRGRENYEHGSGRL